MRTSVVMAVYNGEKYIKRQLESIMSQTKLPDEIIICDDNSTDSTVKVIQDYMSDIVETYGTVEYKLVRNEANKGYIENFRYVMSLSSGDILFTCDQDDVWEPDKVERLCGCFLDEQVQLVASTLRFINAHGKPINREYVPYGISAGQDELVKIGFDRILEKNYFPGCTMAVRRRIVQKYLSITEMPNKIPHDWTMALIAAADDGLFWYNRVLLNYRVHGSNTLGLAAAESKIAYIRKTVSTWPAYCTQLCDRTRFVRRSLILQDKNIEYFESIEKFALYREKVVKGILRFDCFIKECRIYIKGLAGKIDKRGLLLDFIYIFIR